MSYSVTWHRNGQQYQVVAPYWSCVQGLRELLALAGATQERVLNQWTERTEETGTANDRAQLSRRTAPKTGSVGGSSPAGGGTPGDENNPAVSIALQEVIAMSSLRLDQDLAALRRLARMCYASQGDYRQGQLWLAAIQTELKGNGDGDKAHGITGRSDDELFELVQRAVDLRAGGERGAGAEPPME
jgi:hypothetical protein